MTLQATALVHEAYVRLVDQEAGAHWHNRQHFFCAAAEAMRRLLIENARRRKALKHGGGREAVELRESAIVAPIQDNDELLAVDEALDTLAEADSVAADLVRLRYFAGFTMQEAAETLGMSLRNANYVWAYARSVLHRDLSERD